MHPEIDKFAHIDSHIHRWDPRFKLAVLIITAFAFAWLETFPGVTAAIIFSISLNLISKIPVLFVIRRLKGPLFFLFPFFIILPFTAKGAPVFSIGHITISGQGVMIASFLTLKAIAIIILLFPCLSTQPFHLSMKAMGKLGLPSVPVQLVLFTYRYLFVLMGEYKHMRSAMAARSFVPGTNFRTIRVLSNLIGVMMIRSFEKTENIYRAMLARGYEGKLHVLEEFKANNFDILKASLISFAGIVIILFDLMNR